MSENSSAPSRPRKGLALLAAALCLLPPAPVLAQDPSAGSADAFRQLDVAPKMPKVEAFTAPDSPLSLEAQLKSVRFEARLTPDGVAMEEGLTWCVFSPIPGPDGKLPLIATSEGGSADFRLKPGDYFVNVAFGRAGTTKKLKVPLAGEVDQQVLVLDAGGLVLDAVSGPDVKIPGDQLTFSIYSSEVREDGERGLVMAKIKPDMIVRLNAGTYHVVSEYGDVNAVIRADIQVEAGKLTEATLQHRAADITLKLVASEGGEAIADTAWSVLTSSGDVVGESVSAFPSMILAEGDYLAIARNKDKIYQRPFTVQAGQNADVEVLLSQPVSPDASASLPNMD